jgi:N utilization substance protein A
VDPQARVAQVIVPDYQLSLAIGKEGQNARLAARLTGWRIDIRPDSPGADAPVASVAPENAAGERGGRAGQEGQGGPGESGPGAAEAGPGEGGPGEAGPGEGGPGEAGPGGENRTRTDGALASAVSDAPGSAGTMPGAPDAQAL